MIADFYRAGRVSAGPAAAGRAFDRGEIGERLDRDEAVRGQDRANRVRLIVAVLDPQRAARFQARPGARDDRADGGEAVGVVGECAARLEAQIALRQMGIVLRDVRRIAGDGVEDERRIERGVPVACDEMQRSIL